MERNKNAVRSALGAGNVLPGGLGRHVKPMDLAEARHAAGLNGCEISGDEVIGSRSALPRENVPSPTAHLFGV